LYPKLFPTFQDKYFEAPPLTINLKKTLKSFITMYHYMTAFVSLLKISIFLLKLIAGVSPTKLLEMRKKNVLDLTIGPL